jgi:5-methylcytosine-specific restriction endonuclease McrA
MATKKIPRAAMSEEERERKRAIARASYAKHRDRINAALRKSYAQNKQRHHDRYVADRAKDPEKYRNYSRKARAKNPENARAATRRWYSMHKEHAAAHTRAKQLANPAVFAARNLAWIERNREYVRKRQREWDKRNPDKAKARHARKSANKANAPINDFTAEQWEALCAAVKYRCCYCNKKFTAETLTPDHLTPYNEKGSNTLHNVLPCCGRCNSRKGPRPVLKPVQPFLLLVDDSAAD